MNYQGRTAEREQTQRWVTWSAFGMGLGIAAWALPVAALFFDVSLKVFILAIGVAITLSLATFVSVIVYSYQSRAETSRRQHATDIHEVRLLLNQAIVDLSQHIDRVSSQVQQENFNALGNAYIDLMGGPERVAETPTRQIAAIPEARVYRMPQHLNRSNQREQSHERNDRSPREIS